MKGYPSIIHRGEERQDDSGFTLVEILIAIVLVGILSAVVVVGISSLVDKGSKSACATSLESAKAGSIVYFTANNKYPVTFAEMTTGASPALTLPSGVGLNALAVGSIAINMQAAPTGSNPSWALTMTAGAGLAAPTFVCTP